MSGTLADLNAVLFAEMRRLADATQGEELEAAVTRAGAVAQLADKVIGNTSQQLAAARLFATHGPQVLSMLPQIGVAATDRKAGK